jgi:hypothetical protein
MNKRNMVMVLVAMVFTFVGWASGWVFADPSENEKMAQLLQLPQNYYIQGIRNADIGADGITDTIILYGMKEKSEDLFVTEINVATIDGATQAIKKSKLVDFTGYEPRIDAVVDFTGDQKPEIFIGSDTGGSGGYSNYAVIDFGKNVAENILTPEIAGGLAISGKYTDGFKAQIQLKETKELFSVDLSSRKKEYIEEWKIFDKNGKFIGDKNETGGANEIFGYPFGALEAIDVNGDGVSELCGTQRLIGVCNVEQLSNVDSTLRYENGKWLCIEASYRTYIR